MPQSAQSLPFAQKSNSDPGPPSSHTSSDGKSHAFTHALTAGGDECKGEDRSCEGVAGDSMLGWGCSGGSDGGGISGNSKGAGDEAGAGTVEGVERFGEVLPRRQEFITRLMWNSSAEGEIIFIIHPSQ